MAKQKLVVESVQDRDHSGEGWWRVIYLKEDGTKHIHDFPKEILEWRAAEYEIDPADTETLLDIVLHEPFINYRDDVTTAKGSVSKAPVRSGLLGRPVVPDLFTASTVSEAREAHLARVQGAKDKYVEISVPTGLSRAGGKSLSTNPLDVIKNNSPMRPDYLEVKREVVQKQRKKLREAPVQRQPLTEIDKLVMERKGLGNGRN